MNKLAPNPLDKAVRNEREWLYVKENLQKPVPTTRNKRGLSRFFNIIGRGLQCQWLNP